MEQPSVITETWKLLLEKVKATVGTEAKPFMADAPAGFVNNLKSFELIFHSWVLSLWFKMGNTRVFSVYCIFKNKQNICAAWPNLPIFALTLKSCMMFKKDLKCKCCLFFFWGLLISVVILNLFSNYSRRFYLYLYFSWRFMICCWFQMKLQIWHVLLWTLFCLFVYLFCLFFFFWLNVLWEKSLSLCLFLDDSSSPPYLPFI